MSFDLMAAPLHPLCMASSNPAQSTAILAIRQATADDADALVRLAALDSRPVPAGNVLLAIVDGDPVAAVELETGAVVADPFTPTADLVELLHLRSSRLADPASARPSGLRHFFPQRPRITSTA
ncbi:MAG: hypothetical protein QOH43_4834 [Solirubrobacteraceae bacterium]|jgi:hypothetical protein|nr:hypothetical protein [Solirubrobacteraceae bacterium]